MTGREAPPPLQDDWSSDESEPEDGRPSVGTSDESSRLAENMSEDMREFVRQYHDGEFNFNNFGRHVAHELCEQLRCKKCEFGQESFFEALRLTQRFFDLESTMFALYHYQCDPSFLKRCTQ